MRETEKKTIKVGVENQSRWRQQKVGRMVGLTYLWKGEREKGDNQNQR